MSQVKLNLQPPPNVDFVTGYPGIPPGPDRPQASVKGAIEVRVPQAGVKAKWVRIELRKVETLPAGGPSNTFYDFVGPSPVNLWSTSDEYSLLRSQDFPFSIRIPESIPPTIALDNRAGIGYELVASVCTKGKKGFLRKAKSVVVSSIAPIIIDKHELHATWPVYCQPEKRQITQDGVSLVVERNNTCYGPGDRVSVTATVKSDSLHTILLRGFEFFLKETTVFRAGVHAAGRKNAAPQIRQVVISETKVPVNGTLYGGQSHTSELSFMISGNHTTTTLNAARHIDVTYALSIKALMGSSGSQIIMDLPVIISNWQRHVSFEAINRIGPAPSLSLLPATQPLPSRIEPSHRPDIAASTLPTNRANMDVGHIRNNSAGEYNTLPAMSSSVVATKPSTDGLGYGAGFGQGRGIDDFGSTKPVLSINASLGSAPSATASNTATASGRGRLQLKNVEPEEPISRNRSAQATGSGAGGGGSSAPQAQWLSAEEEKRRYEDARNNVVKVQGPAAAPPPISMRPESPPPATSSSLPRGAAAAAAPKVWLSAEEEKRLFQEAQKAVLIKQGLAAQGPQPSQLQAPSGSSSAKLTGAALYAQAVNARSGSASGQAGGSSSASPAKPSVISASPQFMTAEQEKAALRRYEEAKRAVDRTHNADEAPPAKPIAYDSLYPANKPAPTASSSQPIDDAPPSFESAAGSSNIMAHLSEKEKLRRKYEAEDAAAAQHRAPPAAYTPPPAAYTAPPPAPAPTPVPAPAPSLPNQYANALEEKEALRRKFAARDAQVAKANATPPPPVATNNTAVPSTPPPQGGGSSSPARSPNGNNGFRPAPTPPSANTAQGSRVLTAVEEKALLRAKFEARDGGRKPPANGAAPKTTNGPTPTVLLQPSTPPPLMPRPPVEYIKETQEEDARLSKFNGEAPSMDDGKLGGAGAGGSSSALPPSGASVGLDMKPFTPFRAGFETSAAMPGPPPPLPSGSAGK